MIFLSKIFNIYFKIRANLFVAGGDNHRTEWANRTARSRFHVISAKHGEIQRKFKTKTKNEKSRVAQDFA